MQLLERVTAIEDGRRLLRLLADPGAEKSRRPRRAGVIDGSLLDRVRLGGDALVDVAAQRVPRAWTILVDDPRQTGSELRRRMRGQVSSRFVKQAVHLFSYDDGLRVRLFDAALRGPLADPVVTLRAAKLYLDDGRLDGADDLLTGTLRLTDPDALHRRPAAVLTIARLAARPELHRDDAARAATRCALQDGALVRARQSDVWFALPDLLEAPEANEALEPLHDLSAPHPVYEGAEIDGHACDAPITYDAGRGRVR